MALRLTTTAFVPGSTIPAEFTCDGSDVSPALEWSNAPEGVQSFALVVEDPDAPAGTWVHWVLFDVPPSTHDLAEGVPPTRTLASGARQGLNDFQRIGYGGPCPPPGRAHRYYFRLYALDKKLELPSDTTRAVLDRAMRGHVLARAELMGRYRRK
jgi:Raf kinase inhibitor-like YbhB/YbcL family protein